MITPTITPWESHLLQIEQWKKAGTETHKKNLYDIIRQTEVTFRANKIKIPPLHTEIELDKFITQDKQMIKMKHQVRLLATEEYPVLIMGETGTGKEIIARALHGWREGKFVAINCTSLPDYLLESELFGHKKGAFTGALDDKIGMFQYASGGTIFLDEIGDMPVHLQAKLLRVLQEKTIRPVGENKEMPINCRVVAATNQNLKDQIKAGKFRDDLFWRIGTFQINISSLMERPEDIPFIVNHFDKTFPIDKIYNTTQYKVLSGNVRELEALLARWKVFKEI